MIEPVAEYESIIRRTESNFRVPTTEQEREKFLRDLITTKKSTFSSIWPTEGKGRAYEIASFLHSRHTLKLEVIGVMLAILLLAIVASSYLLLAAPVQQRSITALSFPSWGQGPNAPSLPKRHAQPCFAKAAPIIGKAPSLREEGAIENGTPAIAADTPFDGHTPATPNGGNAQDAGESTAARAAETFSTQPSQLVQPTHDKQGSTEPSPLKLLALFIGPPVWIALFQILYTTGSKRRGAATMIIAEVTSIIRVYAAANIIGAFVQKYSHASQAINTEIGGFVDVARKEDYLTIFDRNIEHLGAFPNPLIFHVTSFYTFLKAARDATGALSLWSAPHYPVAQKKADIVDIVYLCFMQMDHGYLALCDLMEKRDREALALIGNVTIGVSLQSYLFLLHVVTVEDFRYTALVSRLRTYRTYASNCGYSDLWNMACPPELLLLGEPAIDQNKSPRPEMK